MSVFLTDRVKSAYPRSNSVRRSRSLAEQFQTNRRPVTSNGRPKTSWRTVELIDMPGMSNFALPKRPKTGTSQRSSKMAAAPVELLQADEIERLVRNLDNQDPFLVQVDCLANYRTLIQSVDLRTTPLNEPLLRALQQRENRIIQRNACRDVRFRSLLETLTPYDKTMKNASKPSGHLDLLMYS